MTRRSAFPPPGALARRINVANAIFLGSFGLSKTLIYFAPILIAALASEAVYGAVELGLAIGLQMSALLLGAPLAGLTQLYLVRGERHVAGPLFLLTVAGSGLAALATILLFVAGAPMLVLMAAPIATLTVVQNTLSTWYRVRGARNGIAWSEGVSLLTSAVVVIGLTLFWSSEATGASAVAFVALTIVILLVSALGGLRFSRSGTLAVMRRAAVIGLPMMVAGAFAIWLAVGGRIMMGLIAPAYVTAYSVAFRIAGITLGIQQLANAAFFPRLYASRVRSGDRLLASLFVAVFLLSIVVALLGPLVLDILSFESLTGEDVAVCRTLIPVNVVMTFFWIGFAMLQMRVNRFGAAKASVVPVIAVTLVGAAVVAIAAELISNDPLFLSWLFALHAAAYFGLMIVLLAKRKVPHLSMTTVGAGGGALLIALAALSNAMA